METPPTPPTPPAPEEPKPLLAVRGSGKNQIERARQLGCLVVVLVAIGTVVGGTYVFPGLRLTRIPSQSWRLLVLVGMAGAYVAERFVRPHTGWVDFYADRIVFVKQRGQMKGWYWWPSSEVVAHEVSVRWEEIGGFDDSKQEFVKILVKQGGSSFHTVPTLSEADRVAVLKLLDEKGVPRVE